MFTFVLYPGDYTPRIIAFIFGGSTGTSPGTGFSETCTNTIRRYDGTTLTTDSATLHYYTKNAGAGSIGTDSYMFGGIVGTGSTVSGNNPTTEIAKYNGSTRSTLGATIGYGANVGCATLGSTLWTFGGTQDYGNTTTGPTRNINSFDGTTVTQVGLLESLLGQAKNVFALACSPITSSVAAMWGGSGSASTYGRLQTWDGSTCTAISSGSPAPTSVAYGAAGTINSKSYRLGGNGATTTIQNFDGTTLVTDSATLSSAKTAPGCSITNGTIKMFGGTTSAITSFNGTTYSTDSSTISNANTAAVCGAQA